MAEETKSTATGELPGKSGGAFSPYKSSQGRYVRMTVFWVLFFLGLYGCKRLAETLENSFPSFRDSWMEGTVPILGVTLNLAFLIAASVFVISTTVLYLYLNRPKPAEFLIETEDELKKVTWPTFGESVDASLVVIGTVIVVGAFIALVDIGLGGIFNKFLFRV